MKNIPLHSKHAAATAANIAIALDEGMADYQRMQRDIVAALLLLVDQCHGNAVNAGWYTDLETGEFKQLNVGERMALIHSEISEAFEAYRKDLNDDHLPARKGVEVELADAVIRIFDLAGAENLDIAGAIIEKLNYNRRRADHTLEARRAANGKKC